jgi:hypothetical protein
MTVQNINNVIAELEAIDPSEEYAYEKTILAFLKIKNFPVLNYEIPAGSIVFRSRTHEENNFFKNVSDISLTPNSFVKSFARCNRPFQSKFYCSENRPTSYMELLNNWVATKNYRDKIYVTIGRWELKETLSTIIITTPEKEKRISNFDKAHGAAMDTFIENCKPEIREATATLYGYLFDKFRSSASSNPQIYIITTAYCNLALSHLNDKANGIYYPSVPFTGQGVNFAISSDFVKKGNMELTHVFRNEIGISENENKKYHFKETEIKQAISQDMASDLIVW